MRMRALAVLVAVVLLAPLHAAHAQAAAPNPLLPTSEQLTYLR